MRRTRIARPKARPLKGSARDRARRCFAWFTFVRDRLQAAVVGRKPLIDESVLDCATLVQSASDVYARSTFGSNSERLGSARLSAVLFLPIICLDLTEISFGVNFLLLRASEPSWVLGVTSVFIAGAAW